MTGKKGVQVLGTVVVLTIALAIGGACIFQAIDFIGTSHHYWQGNVVSVTLVGWLDRGFDAATAYVTLYLAPPVKATAIYCFDTAVGILMRGGMTEHTAKLAIAVPLMITLWIIALWTLYRLVRWDIRSWRNRNRT